MPDRTPLSVAMQEEPDAGRPQFALKFPVHEEQ